MSEFKTKDCLKYNPKVHINHKNPWTTRELEYILNRENGTLAEMSVALGRTLHSVNIRRSKLKKESVR